MFATSPKQIPTVIALIAINAIIFILGMVSDQWDRWLYYNFSLFFSSNSNFHLWQTVTYMFMHGSATHILFNMFGLYAFGGLLERLWGPTRFLVFYFITGIGAGLVFNGINLYEFGNYYDTLQSAGVPIQTINRIIETESLNPSLQSILSIADQKAFIDIFRTPVVGASGAIYGILVAFAFLFPQTKLALIFLPIPIAAKYFVPILLLFDLFSGVTGFSLFGGGIAHFAHIGGALIGFLLMLYWRKTMPRPRYTYR